ncbi:MAG: metallophosphoesterase [Planctomycetes bacterium]|nr:metallophosphoesterase [Planctomycetota bacterium]
MDGPSQDLRVEPRRHGKGRLAAFWLAEQSARFLGGRAFYRRRHLSPGRLRLRREVLPVAGLALELEGFCVVQLSDFHGGNLLSAGSLTHAVELANRERPDLAVLTGDYITHHWRQALDLLDELSGLRARLGVYAVFGNHDYRGRCERRIAEAYAQRGIRFLCNESLRFPAGAGAVALVGVEDLEEARAADVSAARAALQPGDVELVLCHNPRAAPRLARAGVAAILCGHTHGTQVDLPWLRRLGPAHPGARVQLGPTRVITSRGLGVVGLPWRHGAPAEVVALRLSREVPGPGAGEAGGVACTAA